MCPIPFPNRIPANQGYGGVISSDEVTPERDLLERVAATLAFCGSDATKITGQSNWAGWKATDPNIFVD